jgi:hypothetical protein
MRKKTVPEIRPGWDANCLPAMSDSITNIPWKACAMGMKIWGKALMIT